MNFVAYSVILVIHSLSQYTVTAPVPEKQNVFHVQGIIGCSASENGPTSAIPATVEVGSFLTGFEAFSIPEIILLMGNASKLI